MSPIQATYKLRAAAVALLLLFVAHLSAQVTSGTTVDEGNIPAKINFEYIQFDSLSVDTLQQAHQAQSGLSADSSRVSKKRSGIEVSDRIRNFKPEPYKATWLAVVIPAVIYVERDSQKGIIIGKGGKALKRVGTQARREIEAFFGKPVFLQLFVKVDKDWRSSQTRLRHYGYDLN